VRQAQRAIQQDAADSAAIAADMQRQSLSAARRCEWVSAAPCPREATASTVLCTAHTCTNAGCSFRKLSTMPECTVCRLRSRGVLGPPSEVQVGGGAGARGGGASVAATARVEALRRLRRSPEELALIECPILLDEYPTWQMHTCTNCKVVVSCEALLSQVATNLADRLLPAPCELTEGCEHRITPEELCAIHRVYASAVQEAGDDVEHVLVGLLQQLDEIVVVAAGHAAAAEREHITAIVSGRRCPGVGCTNVVIPSSTPSSPHTPHTGVAAKERFVCRSCGTTGCIGCGEARYHYGCECSEVVPLTTARCSYLFRSTMALIRKPGSARVAAHIDPHLAVTGVAAHPGTRCTHTC
jgi:hypothetical protein